MRKSLLLLVLALLPTGCIYEDPLAANSGKPLDPSILGGWSEQAAGDEDPETLMVLKASDSDYVVHQDLGTGDLYYRGYPIEVAGIRCVQLELLASGDALADGEPARYLVVSYELKDGKLSVRRLNKEVVASDLAGTEALQASFTRHKDNEKLFEPPTVYARPKDWKPSGNEPARDE